MPDAGIPGMLMRKDALRRKSLNSPRMGHVMLLPAFVFFALFQLYPFVYGVGLSFTNYYLLTKKDPKFIGLQNFIDIFTDDPKFWPALGFSFVYTIGIVVFSYILGMLFALLLNKEIRAKGLIRAFVLLPWVLSSSVMATNWKWILNDRYGIVNQILQGIGLLSEPLQFFSTAEMARFTVTFVGIWRNVPFMTIVLLAGLQSIPTELYEAASVDGANSWQRFWKITVPQMAAVTLTSTTLMFIWALNGFENIYLLTSGGPVNATTGIAIYSYLTAFDGSRMGYASALSVILMLIMIVFVLIRMKFSRKGD